ncbi:MAG: acyl-CoA synthetase FdrA [Lachnospiraceae bacterium]|nr:acyl-CoA synthetase FdrA [Lachnospiraceae bacterium]
MKKLEVRKNAYYDSVTLMIISKEVKKLDGVREALVGMGTDLNRDLVVSTGLEVEGFDAVTANDFFIAADCDSEDTFLSVIQKVDELLSKKADKAKSDYYPPTLDGALKIDEHLNMAVISVPGRFAAGVAQECLNHDINVMLFSDNVTVEEEKELKEYAVSKELLMMGPDCGTAVINGVPLAFANVLRRGDIGMACASGTGAQEVSVLIDQLGGGVSQLLGTGGRDLKADIGGIMMKQCLDALIHDDATRVITLVSKPPAAEVMDKILRQAADGGKPTVVCFIGGDPAAVEKYGLTAAVSLEDAAHKAVALSKGETPETFESFSMGLEAAEKMAKEEASKMASGQKYARGLYTGGTVCDEAMKLMIGELKHIYSNIPLSPEDKLEDARNGKSKEHTFLDFGDDEFTVGRPHPMIDPSLRAERVVQEAEDREVAVIQVDCVIGLGSHEDPAEELSQSIRKAKEIAAKDGRYLSVVAEILGTDADPQGKAASGKKLEDAGAIVLPSNAQATRFTQLILKNL